MAGMTINPILPIWLMAIICVALLVFKRRDMASFIRQIIAVALIFTINLRIMVPDDNITVEKQKLNAYVIFAIDTTISMLAEDYGTDKGPRLDAVKADVNHVIESFEGAEFAIITFNNTGHVATPFTSDVAYAQSLVNTLYPISNTYARGTSLNESKELLNQFVSNAVEKADGKVIVFFVSDGEITAGNSNLQSFSRIGENVDYGAVMGYGTSAGGVMHVRSAYSDDLETVMDNQNWGAPAMSHIDETNLRRIARDLGDGVEYIHMTSQDKIDPTLETIRNELENAPTEETKQGMKDTYYYFAIPLIGLLMYEFISIKRKL